MDDGADGSRIQGVSSEAERGWIPEYPGDYSFYLSRVLTSEEFREITLPKRIINYFFF